MLVSSVMWVTLPRGGVSDEGQHYAHLEVQGKVGPGHTVSQRMWPHPTSQARPGAQRGVPPMRSTLSHTDCSKQTRGRTQQKRCHSSVRAAHHTLLRLCTAAVPGAALCLWNLQHHSITGREKAAGTDCTQTGAAVPGLLNERRELARVPSGPFLPSLPPFICPGTLSPSRQHRAPR